MFSEVWKLDSAYWAHSVYRVNMPTPLMEGQFWRGAATGNGTAWQ